MSRLLDLLPELHKQSAQTADLQNAFALALSELQAARDDCALQLDVSTATWGLSLWEEAYGIVTDVEKSDNFRRSRIISKMRGAGTTTAAMIQSVASSFSNGEVEVIEAPSQYRFDVKFVGTLGLPPNMDDLTAAIERTKPAHLDYAYLIIYRQQGALQPYTHTQLSAYTHETLRGGELI